MQAHPSIQTNSEAQGCPFSGRISALPKPSQPAVTVDEHQVWHIRGFWEARTVLRHPDTIQAGFGAELGVVNTKLMRSPILYLEGPEHHQLRSQTSKFFTPKGIEKHQALIENTAQNLIVQMQQRKVVDLGQYSLLLAVQVAANVVGLTNSHIATMAQRIQTMAANPSKLGWFWQKFHRQRQQLAVLGFYFFDLLPAIAQRRKTPKEDVVSHCLSLGYKTHEVMAECLVYGAAGMLTTKEFICMATLHFCKNPALQSRYLATSEAERQAILHEILRLEPVIAALRRRTTAPIALTPDLTIPAQTVVSIELDASNTDQQVVGADPNQVCPMRPLPNQVQAPVMSFGDGAHRCPGAAIAIAEADVFLQKLLPLGVKLIKEPKLEYNPLIAGYEFQTMQIQLGGA
jgi:cytochrome P450